MNEPFIPFGTEENLTGPTVSAPEHAWEASARSAPSGGPVFVTGPARSGTTVLAHLLARDLDLACSPETNIMGILNRISRTRPSMTFRDFEIDQMQYLMHGVNRPHCLLFPQPVRDLPILSHRRVLTDALISADRYCDGGRILEQTPRNGEQLCELRWLYPDAPILFVLRNPFDVIQSNRAAPWGTSNVLALALVWARQYTEMAALAQRYGCRRLLPVRYERLNRPGYRSGLFRRLGVSRRPTPIEITPRNFANTTWATGHLSQSVGGFQSRRSGKWTARWPLLQRLGDRLILSALRCARCGRRDCGMRLLLAFAWLSRRRLKR